MAFLSDLLLAAAALGAAAYCFVLSRRLRALATLEGGMGSAIAVLSAQVDGLTRTLAAAQAAAGRSGSTLDAQTRRAETVARRLELLVASMHDLPAEEGAQRPPTRWTGEAAQRPAQHATPDDPDDAPDPAPRARILRRRRDPLQGGGQV